MLDNLKNGNAKGVQAIDKNGNVIYDYNSIAECAKDISRDKQIDYRYIQNSIWRVLKGYRKTYLKLKWVYKQGRVVQQVGDKRLKIAPVWVRIPPCPPIYKIAHSKFKPSSHWEYSLKGKTLDS